MAILQTAKSLEDICFTHIIGTLEEYSIDYLAQLPEKFRRRALHSLPIVDICQLDGTQFTAGLDMDALWKELYKKYIDPHPFSSKQGWKESFLSKIYSTILKNDRPYGFFQVLSRAEKRTPWVGSNMTEDRPSDTQHPVDYVNYLVAAHQEENLVGKEADKEDKEEDEDDYIRRRYGPAHAVMTRHEVTLVKNQIVPPASAYNEKCKSSQVVPRRYASLFPEGSHFLPDHVALELICKKCSFYPKEVSISVPYFATFLHNAEHDKLSLDFLIEFFKEVESLAIHGEPEDNLKWRITRGATFVTPKNIPPKLLELILSNANPKLTSLTIHISKKYDNIINSISPILTTSYSGLNKLILHASGQVSPDLQKMISITNSQPSLNTVSISITEITQIYSSFGPIVKNTPRLPPGLLLTWVQDCFKKPSLTHLKFTLSPTNSHFLVLVLTAFFLAPCSHEQTLTFRINLREESTKNRSTTKPLNPPLKNRSTTKPLNPPLKDRSTTKPLNPPLLHQSTAKRPLLPTARRGISSSSSAPVPPNPSAPDSESALKKFDDTSTQYKSLVFDCCSFEPSFTAQVYQLQPLKLKAFVINDLSYSHTSTSFSQFAQQPNFDVESFQMTSVYMKEIGFEVYDALLQKRSLKEVKFIRCSSVDAAAVRRAAVLRGFHLEEKIEEEKGYKTPIQKYTCTLTKK